MIARRLLFVTAAAAATAIGVATGLYLDARGERAPEIGGYILEHPRMLPAIDLVDEHAAPFGTGDFAGRWSFLYFGYTYCPDVCPLTLVELAKLKRELASERPDERVEYYLISVDPQRDTPARLREYVAYFDPAFRGLTGSHAALAAFAQATDTLFDVPAGQDANNYLVSHSSNLVVLDPDGAIRAVLKPPHDPKRLAADFGLITAHYASHR